MDPDRSLRILILAHDFPPLIGSVEAYGWRLAEALTSTGATVHVVAPDAPDARRIDRDASFQVHRVPLGPNGFVAAAVPVGLATARARDLRIVLATQWTGVPAGLVARRVGVADVVVAAAHGRELLIRPWAGASELAARAYDASRRRALRSADKVVAVSRYTAKLVTDEIGVPPGRVSVIPHGIAPTGPAATGEDAFRFRARFGIGDGPLVLQVGRLAPRKGVDVMLAAMLDVLRRLPTARFVVVGEGAERRALEARAAELGVHGATHFLGQLGDALVGAAYRAADVFVTAARASAPDVEGFGLVFLEAAAAGLPVVGSRVGGIGEVVTDRVSGLLVPPDDPSALARAVLQVLTDRPFARALAAAARERIAKEWAWPVVARELTGELAALLPD